MRTTAPKDSEIRSGKQQSAEPRWSFGAAGRSSYSSFRSKI